jgi:hypothetical protein
MPRRVCECVSYKGGRARALFTVQTHKYCKYQFVRAYIEKKIREYLRCQYKKANTDAAPARGAGRYAKVGARVPAGVLLCGPPGTLCSTNVQIPA